MNEVNKALHYYVNVKYAAWNNQPFAFVHLPFRWVCKAGIAISHNKL